MRWIQPHAYEQLAAAAAGRMAFTHHAPHQAAAAAAADVASTVAPRAIPPAGRPLPCSRRAACGRCRPSSPPHVPPRCGRARRAAWPARSERPCAASRPAAGMRRML
eukprot:365647-Chlamydomonas_euryale.AAC.16